MKTESNIKPSAVVVEEHGDNAEVIFRENITEETREQDGENTVVYVYDEYRLNVPNRAGLLKTVKAAKKNWLEAAKSAEYDARVYIAVLASAQARAAASVMPTKE